MAQQVGSVALALAVASSLLLALLQPWDRGRATPRSAPSEQGVPAPAPEMTALVPLGSPAALGDGWLLTVRQVVPNATAAVVAASPRNAPPAPGRQFFVVRISAVFAGSDACECGPLRVPSPYSLRGHGASGRVYTGFDPSSSCGLEIPGGLPPLWESPAPYAGRPIEGNVCWQIEAADQDAITVSYQPLERPEVAVARLRFATQETVRARSSAVSSMQ